MSTTTNTPSPAGFTPIEDSMSAEHGFDALHIGPESLEPNAEWGVKLLSVPESIHFGMSSDTSMDALTRDELLEMGSAIDQTLAAADKLG